MSFRQQGEPPPLLVATGRQVTAANPETGKVLWKYVIGSSRAKGLARVGLLGPDRVVVAHENDLHCVDLRSGKTVWKEESPIAVQSLFVTVTQQIFVARGGELACFDAAGKLLWHELLGGEGPVSIVMDGVVLHADEIDDAHR